MGSHHDIEHEKVIFLRVFMALIVGTIVTVAAYFIHFENFAITVALALFIASIKASCVACYFMHLLSEKKLVYLVMGFTAFFFAAMMLLFIWGHYDLPRKVA